MSRWKDRTTTIRNRPLARLEVLNASRKLAADDGRISERALRKAMHNGNRLSRRAAAAELRRRKKGEE